MKNKIALYTALGAVIISSVITIMGAVSIFNENVDYSFLNGSANKVILFVGDGMGENHIQVASTKLEREIFFTTFDKEGYVETNSNTLFSPTDSAAAATATAIRAWAAAAAVADKPIKNQAPREIPWCLIFIFQYNGCFLTSPI